MKNISRPQHYRIKRIVELIRRGTKSGTLINANTLCRELGVSRPTIMRDLDFLRYEENAPIKYIPQEHGYVLSEETWELPSTRLSSTEMLSFAVAQKLLAGFKGTPLANDMTAALQKIGKAIEGAYSFDFDHMAKKFTAINDDYVMIDPCTWKDISEAVDTNNTLTVKYQKFDGRTGSYTLEPYHLLSYHGNWYLLARNVEKDSIATFAISRIKDISIGREFDMPVNFDITKHIEHAFGIVKGNKLLKVRVLCSANIASYIKERIWQKGQVIKEMHDGSIELIFETTGWKELVRWILSWQPDMKVITPKKLKLRIEEKLKQGIAYGKSI